MAHILTRQYVASDKSDQVSRLISGCVTTRSPTCAGATVEQVSSTLRSSSVHAPGDVRTARPFPPPLALALVLGLLGAVAVSAAPIVDVGSGPGASGSIVTASIFAALCALVIPAAAIVVARRHPALSGALLAGAGALSFGVAILDLQLFVDAIDANRLELFRPISAGVITAGVGSYVALLGHALLVVAGILGLVVIHRESERDGYGSAHAAEYDGRSVGGRIGAWPTSVLILAAGAYVLSLFAPAFDSQDPIFLARSLVDSPAASAVGTALVAVAVLIVTASALTSISPWVGAGGVVGAGVGALGVSGTRVVAGLASGDRIGVGAGSIVGAIAAVVIVGVGAVIPILSARREAAAAEEARPVKSENQAQSGGSKKARRAAMIEQAREAQAHVTKMHRIAGALGIGAAVSAALGASLPILSLPGGLAEPSILATRIVFVAAIVLFIASLGLWIPGRAVAIRPAVGTLWTTVVMGIAAVVQPAVIATDVSGVDLGTGVYVMGVACALAAAAGLALWFAGTAEREEIDTSVEIEANSVVRLLAGLGGVLALGGTALPLYRGANHTAASITQWPWGSDAWGIDTWGQLLVGVSVLLASVVATRSRPPRAVALLVGSAVSVSIYLAAGPLTSSRIPDATVGAGAIAAATGLLLLVVAAFFSARTTLSMHAERR